MTLSFRRASAAFFAAIVTARLDAHFSKARDDEPHWPRLVAMPPPPREVGRRDAFDICALTANTNRRAIDAELDGRSRHARLISYKNAGRGRYQQCKGLWPPSPSFQLLDDREALSSNAYKTHAMAGGRYSFSTAFERKSARRQQYTRRLTLTPRCRHASPSRRTRRMSRCRHAQCHAA